MNTPHCECVGVRGRFSGLSFSLALVLWGLEQTEGPGMGGYLVLKGWVGCGGEPHVSGRCVSE
jgi:hypothetical protein